MIRPAGAARPLTRLRRSVTAPLTLPYRGLNTRQPLAELDPVFALKMLNLIPDDGSIKIRKGYAEHATGVTGGVETLMRYKAGATQKLFACGNNAIYDATSAGAVGSAVVTSLTNNRWDWTMFGTLGGSYLVCANAADGIRTYDGTNWATQSITGATAATLKGIMSHKSRLWAIQTGTLDAWYMDSTLAIAGGMTKFPLGPLCRLGGELASLATWTLDGGSGMDDHFVAITTNGEVLVYAGTDPSTASWYLVGRYLIPKPIGGTRCTTNVGGSLWILTEGGIVAMEDVMQGADGAQRVTRVIEPTFREASAGFGSTFGWQVVRYLPEDWVVVNAPQSGGEFTQLIYINRIGAWTQLTGMDAKCWVVFDDYPYFGAADGKVYKADTGKSDDGDPIDADVIFSPNRFGTPNIKRFTATRLHYRARGDVRPAAAMLINYDEAGALLSADLSEASVSSPWDTSAWDVTPWGGSMTAGTRRVGINGIGAVGALRVKILAKDTDLEITGAEVAFEVGSLL